MKFLYEVIATHNGRRVGDIVESDVDIFNPYLVRIHQGGSVVTTEEVPAPPVRKRRTRKVEDVENSDLPAGDPQDGQAES